MILKRTVCGQLYFKGVIRLHLFAYSLNGFKYFYISRIILSNINPLFAHK